MRGEISLKHYGIRTEGVYVHWIKRYILFHGKQTKERPRFSRLMRLCGRRGLRRL
ncbi:MAG: hypothetical protein WC091_05675 [Sulfuricellaceae bacterium]